MNIAIPNNNVTITIDKMTIIAIVVVDNVSTAITSGAGAFVDNTTSSVKEKP